MQPMAPSSQNVLVRRIAAVEGAELVTDDPETVPVTIPTVRAWTYVAVLRLLNGLIACQAAGPQACWPSALCCVIVSHHSVSSAAVYAPCTARMSS